MIPPLTLAGGAFRIDGDRDPQSPTLAEWLERWSGGGMIRKAVARILTAVAEASVPLARRLARGALPGDLARVVGTNTGRERQKALDLAAHAHFAAALKRAGAHELLSEEAAEVETGTAEGLVSVAFDPVDGSTGIAIGAPLGTLFAVYPRSDIGPFYQRPGRDILAAGYVAYGSALDLAISVGEGVVQFGYDPEDGCFRLTRERITIPAHSPELAFNAANLRHYGPGVRAYVDAAMAGREGPFGVDSRMRWFGSAVMELHRILHQGGVFLSDRADLSGYEQGRLRLVYEAVPLAFLCEQAGGRAIDGQKTILDLVPDNPHQRTPLMFGGRGDVERLERMTVAGGR